MIGNQSMVDIQLILINQTIYNMRNATLEHEISLSCPVNSVTVSSICDTQLRN